MKLNWKTNYWIKDTGEPPHSVREMKSLEGNSFLWSLNELSRRKPKVAELVEEAFPESKVIISGIYFSTPFVYIFFSDGDIYAINFENKEAYAPQSRSADSSWEYRTRLI
jgi:hypothetical protein